MFWFRAKGGGPIFKIDKRKGELETLGHFTHPLLSSPVHFSFSAFFIRHFATYPFPKCHTLIVERTSMHRTNNTTASTAPFPFVSRIVASNPSTLHPHKWMACTRKSLTSCLLLKPCNLPQMKMTRLEMSSPSVGGLRATTMAMHRGTSSQRRKKVRPHSARRNRKPPPPICYRAVDTSLDDGADVRHHTARQGRTCKCRVGRR